MDRLSIRDSTFSSRGDAIEVVVVNAARVSRSYYADDFNADKTVAPTCWSVDTQRPDPSVPESQRQANRCMDCKQNIRGSAGRGRACRFSQRLAVAFVDDLEKIYQLQLPATSIFGKTVRGHMPLQEYVRHLSKNNTRCASVVTKIYFDSDSPVPKLFFKPTGLLSKEQLEIVESMITHPDTKEAITLAVADQSVPSSPFGITEGFEFKPKHS
jgi:hypothetical protein